MDTQAALALATEYLRDYYIAMAPQFQAWQELDASMAGVKEDRLASGSIMERLRDTQSGKGQISTINAPILFFVHDYLRSTIKKAFLSRDTIWDYSARGMHGVKDAETFQNRIRAMGTMTGSSLELGYAFSSAVKYGQGYVVLTQRDIKETIWEAQESGEVKPRDIVHRTIAEVNVSPYRMVRDHLVAPDRVDEMRFIGHWYTLPTNEVAARYGVDASKLPGVEWLGNLMPQTGVIDNALSVQQRQSTGQNPITVVLELCIMLPADVCGHESAEPHLLTLCGLEEPLAVRRLNPPIGRYPYFSAIPDGDGEAINPPSRIDIARDLASLYNWNLNNRVVALKRDISGDYVLNPFFIMAEDIAKRNPEGGNVYRVAQRAMGYPDAAERGLRRLNFENNTSESIRECQTLFEIIKILTGASDAITGVDVEPSSRRTAEEIARAADNANLRIEDMLSRIHYGFMMPLGTAKAKYYQQLALDDRVLPSRTDEHETQAAFADLMVPYDVVLNDGFINADPRKQAESLRTMLEYVMRDPKLSMAYNVGAMIEALAKKMGVPAMQQFISPEGVAELKRMAMAEAQQQSQPQQQGGAS